MLSRHWGLLMITRTETEMLSADWDSPAVCWCCSQLRRRWQHCAAAGPASWWHLPTAAWESLLPGIACAALSRCLCLHVPLWICCTCLRCRHSSYTLSICHQVKSHYCNLLLFCYCCLITRVMQLRCGWSGGLAIKRLQVRLPLGHCWCNNFGQVVRTLMPLSPSSASWWWCKNWEGNGRLWKWRGLSSITLSVSSLLAQTVNRR